VLLPTVTYLGAEFVPAFTSAGRLAIWLGRDPVPPFAAMPHIVVPAAELARRMPSGVGIALNPGAEASVPIYPEGVGYLAATLVITDGTPVRARTSRTRSTPGSRRTPSPSTSGPRPLRRPRC
jgi:hypothetical protein